MSRFYRPRRKDHLCPRCDGARAREISQKSGLLREYCTPCRREYKRVWARRHREEMRRKDRAY